MKILRDYDLTPLNTFGVPARAKFFTEVANEAELQELFASPEFQNNDKLFLGGGSNVLFTKDFDGIVILNKLTGIEVLEEDADFIKIKATGGEVWHHVVSFAVERGLWGIENLSLIPGTVGAAPMQNIGAYGAELKSVLESVEAFAVDSRVKKVFTADECELGYRDSIFKNKVKGKYFISSIILKLAKNGEANLSYKVLAQYVEKNNIDIKNSRNISEAVAEIRRSKLPDPKVIGNAGSFFKNVFVPEEKFKELLKLYPDMPHFEEDMIIKIPAGWLIEQCGWKGKRVGHVGVHDKQALVIVNHGGATGEEIKTLALEIIDSVFNKFGLKLTPEVNFI